MNKAKLTKTSVSYISILMCALSVVMLSPKTFAGCGQGPECRPSEYCNMVCPSPPGVGECKFECKGSKNTNEIALCPAGYVVSFANPTYSCGRGTAEWQRSVGCCQWSGGGQTCGDFYHCPTKNNKDKMCRDCTTEDPFCYPYNSLLENGTCIPILPPQSPLTGYVWEDSNGDNVLSATDLLWSDPTVACLGKRTSPIQRSATLNVTLTGQSSADTWSCASGTPMYTTPAYAAAASRSFTIAPPNNYDCRQIAWSYSVCDNAACTATHTGSGTGCTATIANYSGSLPNYLNWRVNQVIPRTISGTLYETSNPASCNSSASLGLPGLSVSAFNTPSGQAPVTAAVTNGSYTISGLSSSSIVDSVCVNGSLSSSTASYRLSCVKSTGFTCTSGSGGCAVNCTPTNIFSTVSPTLSFGFSVLANEKWFNVVDGDIYGDSIVAAVAPNPLGGFSPYLVNTVNGTSVGGFGFSAGLIDTQTTGTTVSEKGGAAQRLSVLPSYVPNDQWLNKFSFSVPAGAITSVPSGNKFDEGKVYSFTVAQFNTILSSGSYSFTGGNSNAPAASIVYVTGSGTINITKNFVSTNTDKTLLVVTTADVNISKDPGTTTTSYAVNGPSQIDLVVISQKDINFASQYNLATSTFDSPLMVYGSLVASGTINPDRDLGGASNSSYPATSIRFYPYLMSLIQKYEIANTTSSPYTGLTTVDVQFDYSE